MKKFEDFINEEWAQGGPHWELNFEHEVDEVGTFWVVTYPDKDSTLADCCYSNTIDRIIVQKQGGLEQKEVFGFFTNEARAKNRAQTLLNDVKKSHTIGRLNKALGTKKKST